MDYLDGRQQKVIVRNEESEWCDLISGVPQGSVLGPLLSGLLYMLMIYLRQLKVECLMILNYFEVSLVT